MTPRTHPAACAAAQRVLPEREQRRGCTAIRRRSAAALYSRGRACHIAKTHAVQSCDSNKQRHC
jgi:hypothetical protein